MPHDLGHVMPTASPEGQVHNAMADMRPAPTNPTTGVPAVPLSEVGQPGGVAQLDNTGVVPDAQVEPSVGRIVVHGATAGTARPATAIFVHWIGSVAPTNAATNDEWTDTANKIVKRWNGSSFDSLGSAASLTLADKGAWATSTAYGVGDVVAQSGARYIAKTAHTSGTFASDLAANWTLIDGMTPQSGTLAARPAATGSRALYTATDVAAGTTYQDTAAGVWTQIAGPVTPAGLGGPSSNFTPQNFKKWRKALSTVRNGGGYAKVLVAGDSTSWGKGGGGANPPYNNAWPKRLQELFQSYYVPASIGLNYYANPDPADSRWTLGSGWGAAPVGTAGFAGWSLKGTSGAAGTAAFAPGYACDTADIYYVQNSLGTSSVAVDGGSSTNLTTAGSAAVKKTTVTFTLGAAHSIVFTGPTSGDFYILGVDCYDSTTKSVRVALSGVSGSKTSDWIDNATAYRSLGCVSTYAPDLTLIMLGINDAALSTTSASWQTNMGTLITTAQASGDVVIVTVVPSQALSLASGAPGVALEQAYATAAQTVAATYGCGVIDINSRFVDYTTANAAGYMSDGLHPTGSGYCDIAQAVFNALKTI